MQSEPSASPPRPAPAFGEPAPFFTAATDGVPRFSLEVTAGRWIVLMFFGSLAAAPSRAALEQALNRRTLFNGADAAFWGVSVDPADRAQRGLANLDLGFRYFWDFDCAVARLYGVADETHIAPAIFLIDPAFRVALAEPIEATASVLDRLEAELAAASGADRAAFAPVLTLPRVLEPDLCETLIDHFRRGAPKPSGFAANDGGRTIELFDPTLKRRADVTLADAGLVEAVRARLQARLFPMVRRAFGWQAGHIERYLVCRYGAEDQGFFFAHRDDATAGSAHRKFAVTVNLNQGFEGGDLRFPEFGRRLYRPEAGGATVFCCSLLHEATPVTKGERFALVPFLYDDEGARLREANLALVEAPALGSG